MIMINFKASDIIDFTIEKWQNKMDKCKVILFKRRLLLKWTSGLGKYSCSLSRYQTRKVLALLKLIIAAPLENSKAKLQASLATTTLNFTQPKLDYLYLAAVVWLLFQCKSFLHKWSICMFGINCSYHQFIHIQGSGIGHVANNYLRPILLLPKKTSFK